MKKLVTINGSYRKYKNTYKCLKQEEAHLMRVLKDETHDGKATTKYFYLDDNIYSCHQCKKCVPGCRFKDQFQDIVEAIGNAEHVLIGSPVYLDFPSPKLLAFLTRLTSLAESTNREFFRGKKMHFVATAWCSGTKTVIHTLMGACEMLGFTIEGRSTKEYIELWKDNKIRGGMRPEDACYFPKDEK
jgi:multimeric flavodoxin WrbA